MAEKGRTGILGGTFDPVHSGHLAIARAAREQLGLDRVLFVPAGQPWRKDREITSAEHRIAMVRLAIEDEPAYQLSTVEIDRNGPSYMVDTLKALGKQFPGSELVLILGQDALVDLPNWKDAQRILSLALLAIAPRGGRQLPKDDSWRALPGISERTVWLEMEPVVVSSTSIRARIHRGSPVRGLAPPAVEEYFRKHRLYSRSRKTPGRPWKEA
jgi:nicotinate-nucleotide adenylyltransferase